MSVRVNLDQLTDQQKKIIREKLFFQPKKTNFSVNKFVSTEKDPVLFYWIDKPNNQIVLPYTFANSLLGKHINSSLDYPPGKFNFTGKLRDNQIPVAETALQQLRTSGTTTLSLPTGFGKSILGAYLSCQCGGLALVLTPRETIQTGWIKTYSSSTNAGIWVIDSKMKIPEQCNVILTMDGKFEKIPYQIRKMVSTLIIDEAHMFCTPTQVPVLLGTVPKYVIACSATLSRPDDMHRMITSIVGNHQIEVKNDKKFTVYKFLTGISTPLVKNKMGTTDFSKLTAALANDPIRNAFIVDLIEKNPQHKIMLLSWSKKHISLLYDILKKRGVSVDYLIGTKSSYVDSQVLLGSISKVSTGFDSKNVAIDFDGVDISMLILVGSTKSYNLHIQSIGRCFRSESPVIIDFVDNNRISKSHWNARRKHYQEMNCEIIDVVMHKRGQDEQNNTDQEIDHTQMHNSRLKAYQHLKVEAPSSTINQLLNNKVVDKNVSMHVERLQAYREKLKK